jgi:hypothetical protein
LVRQRRIWNARACGIAIMSDSSIRSKPVVDQPSKPCRPRARREPACAIANDLSCPKMSVSQNPSNSTVLFLDPAQHLRGGRGVGRRDLALQNPPRRLRGSTATCRCAE